MDRYGGQRGYAAMETSDQAEEKFAFTERFIDTYRTKTEKGKKVVKKDEVKKEEKKKEEVKEGF